MKKIVLPFLMLLAIVSCQKTNEAELSNYESTATIVEKNAKSTTYLLTVLTGHPASECKGCVTINGQTVHIDCMGHGNACTHSAMVSLVKNNNDDIYTATTLDSMALTNEDFFNMPARSLFVEFDNKNNAIWLNIPAQMVYRDSVSRQFTFTGLYYTDSQVYGGN